MIRYTCPQCGAKLESSESLAGKLDKCPMCGYECPVPSPKPQGLARETRAGDERGTLDPEALADWTIIGLYHAETIIRQFGKPIRQAWTKAMQAETPEPKAAEIQQIWDGMIDQVGDKLRQIAGEAEAKPKPAPAMQSLQTVRKEHNMRKWIKNIGPALDAWRWRIISLSALIFALSFAVWVFRPMVGWRPPHGGVIQSKPLIFDTRTGQLSDR